MKALLLSVLLFMQGADIINAAQRLFPAETVASNSTSTGFLITFTSLSGGQNYSFVMEPGFYNVDNKWQIAAGFYDVTFSPLSSPYGATYFSANGSNTTKYGSSNTGPVTLSNVQLYEGGGNQVIISPQ